MYRFIVILGLLLVSFGASSQKVQVKPASKNLATDYVDFTCQLIQFTGMSPTNASRMFGYIGLTLYESLVHDMPTHRSLVGQINGLTQLPQPDANQKYNWEIVANSATRTIIDSLLLAESDRYKFYAAGLGYKPIDTLYAYHSKKIEKKGDKAIVVRSEQYGQQLAQAIFEFAKTDGGDWRQYPKSYDAYQPYKSPAGASWQESQTKEKFSSQPTWGNNRTFIQDIKQIALPETPIQYSTQPNSQFYNQAKEVYEAVRDNDFEHRLIAEYWKDGASTSATPPGHSMCILSQLLQEKQTSLQFAAYAYAKLGMALSDAFVCCWKTKYETNQIRPETYIKLYIDSKFKPPIATPPFPEYTSGHSVQAGAAAEVLTNLFGEDYAFTDRTHQMLINTSISHLFTPRSFKNFYAMATEASMSRVYGGIHFRQACESGVQQGRVIGTQINALNWSK